MKEKILFLPSAWSNELVFTPQIAMLKHDYEVIVLDTTSFDTITKLVEHVVNHYQNVKCIIGLSLGGLAALELIADYPDFVPLAILIGTQAHAFDSASKQFYENMIEQVQQNKLAELCQFFVEAVTCRATLKNHELVNYIARIPLAVGNEGCINHNRAAISYQDQTSKLTGIKTKTLIMCGEEDQGTPVAYHEVLARHIPNSKFITIPEAAHFVTLEQPEIVNNHISDWLKNN